MKAGALQLRLESTAGIGIVYQVWIAVQMRICMPYVPNQSVAESVAVNGAL